MKILVKSFYLLILLLFAANVSSQNSKGSAVLCGRIHIEQDSIYPFRPYSIILRKDWPITIQQFEQQEIDTIDYSFKIKIDLNQITYGIIIVNFFQDIDSTALVSNRSWWISSEVPDSFLRKKYAARILSSWMGFVIEPGDSLNINIDYEKLDQYGRAFVNFSGLGGANNNLFRSKDYSDLNSKSFKMPLEAGLSNEDLLMENEIKNLNEAKDSISHEYYNLLKTDILFKNLKMKHALIRASLYGSDIKIEEKRAIARERYTFIDTLTLRSEYLNSTQFRGFLNFYLEYLNRIITGDDIPFRYNEKSYWLAKAVFNKELLKAFLYERLAFQIETPFFYNTETFQYKDFITRYPNTPESHRLKKIYTKHFPVSNGQLAPELELIDSIGRKKHVSELRGKVVIISTGTAWLYALRNKKKINRIESIQRRFGDDIVMIALNLRYQRSSPLSPYIDYYVAEDHNSQSLCSYNFLRSNQYTFIISKSGTIINCIGDLDISDETISELISEKYTLLTKLKYTAQRYINEIVVILSILISLTLILLLFSRLRQKRQDLIKKQLNSELKAIRSQLNPHFLFNSLNSIQNFINNSDSKTANIHLSKFSLLMRRVIELSEKESTTLKEELDFNKTFIELEQLRYGFKCKFEIDNSIDLFNTEIPSMIIQPFIENAIVHCMAELGAEGELGISVKEKDNDKIFIGITDNGKGFPSDTKKGFGLKSSRERIDLLNSKNRDKIELYIESPTDSQVKRGSIIKLIIPKKY